MAIAFAEAGVVPKEYRVDLANKPSWYHEVNPALKVLLSLELERLA